MRTVTSTITTLETSNSMLPRHSILARTELLSFGSATSNPNSSIKYTVPQTFINNYVGAPSSAWATYLTTSGALMLRAIGTSTASDYFLDTVSARVLVNTLSTMRAGLYRYTSGTVRAMWAEASGANTQLKYIDITSSFTNPIGTSSSNYGSVIPVQLVNTSGLVRRVEAVLIFNNYAIVAFGTHDFTNDLSTINFWYVSTSQVHLMETVVQYAMTDTYSNWYSHANWASHITGYDKTSGTETDKATIVLNAHPSGRAMMFTYWNGVESTLQPIIPVDEEQNVFYFDPASITLINNLYYLTGRVTKNNLDDKKAVQSSLSFDSYLTSADLENWSFGERSSFLCSNNVMGKMMFVSSTRTVVYGGNGLFLSAPATYIQDTSVSANVLNLDSRFLSFSAKEATGSADSLELSLFNGDMVLKDHAIVKRNATLSLSTGQDTDLIEFGRYSIDSISGTIDAKTGSKAVSIRARDLASKALSDWKSLTDLWIQGTSDLQLNLSTEDKILVKSPIREIEVLTDKTQTKTDAEKDKELMFTAAYGMRYRGLNNPGLIFADTPDADGLIKANVTFLVSASNNPHSSMVGVVFGANEDANGNFSGNVVLIPKDNSWASGLTEPIVSKFAFTPIDSTDPNKEDTGLKNLRFRRNPLYSVSGSGMTARTVAATGTYRVKQAGYMIPSDLPYQVAVRRSGARIQYYTKLKDTNSTTRATNSFYILRGEFLWGQSEPIRQTGKNYGGLCVSTDVFGDVNSFVQSVSDDMEVNLNDAKEYGTNAALSVLGTVNKDLSNNRRIFLPAGFDLTKIWVGKWVMLSGVALQIVGIEIGTNPSGGSASFWLDGGSTATNPITMREILSNGTDVWAIADSGYKYEDVVTDNITGAKKRVYKNSGAKISSVIRKGRAAFISDDNTALSIRYIQTNGTWHELMSGSTTTGVAGSTSGTVYTSPNFYAALTAFGGPGGIIVSDYQYEGGTSLGWDFVNPLPAGEMNAYGSEPSAWRMLFHHNYIFYGNPSIYALPNGNSAKKYFKIDDEIVRYATVTFAEPGMSASPASKTWTVIPTFYSVLRDTVKNSTQIKNWWWTATGPAHYIGDNLGDLKLEGAISVDPVGLLVEFSSRTNNDETEKETQYYGVGSFNAVPGTYGGASYITLNKAYPNSLRDGDLAITSGRGQFNTKKVKHEETAPVVYYPCDSSGAIAEIQVNNLSVYSGKYRSTQDAIKYIAAFAGVRNMKFRNAFSSAYQYAWYPMTVSTTLQSLPLYENLANFTLEGYVHLPGKGWGTGNYSNKLNIYFRNYYRLTLQQYNSTNQLTSGYNGNVMVALSTTTTDISAPSTCNVDQWGNIDDTYRWLEGAVVFVSDRNISGSTSGSGNNWTHTESTGTNIYLKLVVNQNDVIVEINGKQVWTFDLDALIHSKNPGPIQIEYTSSIGGNSALWWVQELGSPNGNFAARSEQSSKQIIDEMTKDRHILSRATTDGGIEFGQFWNRDDFGALTANLISDKWSGDDKELNGHIQVSGKVTSDYIDELILKNEGYKFESSQNAWIETNEDAQREARLQIRLQKELIDQRDVSGFGRIGLQPEDKVAFSYDMGSGQPSQASVDMIVTDIDLSADTKSVKGTYTLRKYISSF